MDELSRRLAENLRRLREERALTQQDAARAADLPRATWATLETGAANPTLAVLVKCARALGVSLETLVAEPAAPCRLRGPEELPRRTGRGAEARGLLAERVEGLRIERIELRPRGRLQALARARGAREFVTCESGRLEVALQDARWTLEAGQVLAVTGGERMSYRNAGRAPCVAYSVIAG
ncbi:MAG: helix-turn-helix domain-containing protein [Polyangiaceae bacterium]|nr:helix-turn-helix domain-containing protein [Polyangiaceae bacterium]